MNLSEAQKRFLPQIEAEMRRVMSPPAGQSDAFFGMMHYHLGWLDEHFAPAQASAGKRLRPLFTLLACRAAGGEPERALPAAAAVELVHNFSLVHDDIQDNSDTRRGRPTVWRLWGMPQAINAGDAMFVLARHALLRLSERGVSPPTVLNAVARLDRTCLTLCRGQYLDMDFEGRLDVRLADYLEMIEAKTAALLACAGYLGGLVATEDPARAETFWSLGRALGLAFQIQDDWLGIWGEERITGKPAADDLRRRKKSLPVVYALGRAAEDERAARFRALYAQPHRAEETVSEAIALLEATGAKEYTEQQARHHAEAARAALQAVDAPPGSGEALQEMVQFMIERAY